MTFEPGVVMQLLHLHLLLKLPRPLLHQRLPWQHPQRHPLRAFPGWKSLLPCQEQFTAGLRLESLYL